MDPQVLKIMVGSAGFGVVGGLLGFFVCAAIDNRGNPPTGWLPLAGSALGGLVGQYVGIKLMLGK